MIGDNMQQPTMTMAASVSNKNNLEQWIREDEKSVRSVRWILSGAVFVCIVLMFWAADNGREEIITPIVVMGGILGVLSLWVEFRSLKVKKQYRKFYDTYLGYCNTEELLIDSQKVFGNCHGQAIMLQYKEIQDAQCDNMQYQGESGKFNYGRLTIVTTSNQQYHFYSFENAQTLWNLIKMYKQNIMS